jgi:hypothetical protein
MIWLLLSLSLSLILRPTVSRPVCLGIKHPPWACDQIFITVRQLLVCWCGALSLTRGRICHLQLQLILAGAVIFGSDSRGTRDDILPFQIRDFPFRRLLRLAGLRWRYSTPLLTGRWLLLGWCPRYNPSARTIVENPVSNSTFIEACASVATGTCLPILFLAAAVYSFLLKICCLAANVVSLFVSRFLPRAGCIRRSTFIINYYSYQFLNYAKMYSLVFKIKLFIWNE